MADVAALSGIYQITNTVNGKRYIGSAVNLRQRCHTHRWDLRKSCHRNGRLQASWNKHGEGAFEFTVIEVCERGALIAREQAALDGLKPEYNICKVAGSSLGVKHGPEMRAKLSAAKKNMSAETRARIGAAGKGRKLSAETIAKVIAALTGTKRTAEQRANMSAAGRLQSAEKRAKIAAASRSRTHSAETRAKISAAQKGKKRSPESVAKMAATNKGRKHSAETIVKMKAAYLARSAEVLAALTGRPVSVETRVKISASNKVYWARSRQTERTQGAPNA